MAEPICAFCGLPGTNRHPLLDPEEHYLPEPEHETEVCCIEILQERIKKLEARVARWKYAAGDHRQRANLQMVVAEGWEEEARRIAGETAPLSAFDPHGGPDTNTPVQLP